MDIDWHTRRVTRPINWPTGLGILLRSSAQKQIALIHWVVIDKGVVQGGVLYFTEESYVAQRKKMFQLLAKKRGYSRIPPAWSKLAPTHKAFLQEWGIKTKKVTLISYERRAR